MKQNTKQSVEQMPNDLTGRVRVRSSAANESVEQIERYLVERLGASGSLAEANDAGGILVDIDIMGWPRLSVEPVPRRLDGEALYPVRLARSRIFLGPFYGVEGACPTCLERRWTAIRAEDERAALEDASTERGWFVFGHSPWLTTFALDAIWQVAQVALEGWRTNPTALEHSGQLYVIDLETLSVAQTFLIPDSLCPACTTPPADTPANATLALSSRPKPDAASYRLTKLEDIDLEEAAYVNPHCGVVGTHSIRQHSIQLLTAPVSGQFRIRDVHGDHAIWWRGHDVTYDRSNKIGIMEGLERYDGLKPRGKAVSVFDSYRNLAPDALNPEDSGLYPSSFYANNPGQVEFTPDLKFHWVWGYSLTEQRPILVPKQFVYYFDYTRPEPGFVKDCSSGCATGSCLEEAILYGLIELFERDSFLIAWNARLALPRIDGASSRNLQTLHLLERVSRYGYDVHFLDMRLDISIPSVMCVALRRDEELGSMILAAGAGFDPEDTIRGALHEVASAVSDFPKRVADEEAVTRAMASDFRKVLLLRDHAPLYGLPEMAEQATRFLLKNPVIRSVEETYEGWRQERPRNTDLLADVQFCIDQLEAVGLRQVIVVDQTSPEQARLGLKTVCVRVPGLLPIDFGYERQRALKLPRLRTVPRTSGFLTKDFSTDDINPLPHPFP
ncbi:MAG TPA: TOMM precursor leader peptide-binding protein [Pyrinomonadaceae bacterium]|jgi:ribosomal protein S12 methylthiotransferase accessory factor